MQGLESRGLPSGSRVCASGVPCELQCLAQPSASDSCLQPLLPAQAREQLGAGSVMDPSKPGFGLLM